jgi:hypothetical protein
MKRNEIYQSETKRNETKWNDGNLSKRNETERNEMKHNEIYRNETERNETKWNVHKNWKGMQFSETNIPKRNKTEYVETCPFRYISFRVSFRILQVPKCTEGLNCFYTKADSL